MGLPSLRDNYIDVFAQDGVHGEAAWGLASTVSPTFAPSQKEEKENRPATSPPWVQPPARRWYRSPSRMPLKCKMDTCSVCQARGWAQERPLGLLLGGASGSAILRSSQQRHLPSLAAWPWSQYPSPSSLRGAPQLEREAPLETASSLKEIIFLKHGDRRMMQHEVCHGGPTTKAWGHDLGGRSQQCKRCSTTERDFQRAYVRMCTCGCRITGVGCLGHACMRKIRTESPADTGSSTTGSVLGGPTPLERWWVPGLELLSCALALTLALGTSPKTVDSDQYNQSYPPVKTFHYSQSHPAHPEHRLFPTAHALRSPLEFATTRLAHPDYSCIFMK
jgi:hypothetical protein